MEEISETDRSFRARLLRGHEKLKRIHKEQLERYLPKLPVFKVSNVQEKPADKNNAPVIPMIRGVDSVGAYLPRGFERFIDNVMQQKERKKPGKIPKIRTLRMDTILSSDCARKLLGYHVPTPPKGPSLSSRKTSTPTASEKTGPIINSDALWSLYNDGNSFPSERIGGFYSIALGTLSPIRLYLDEVATRRNTAAVPLPVADPLLLGTTHECDSSPQRFIYDRIDGCLPLELFDQETNLSPGPGYILQYKRGTSQIIWKPCRILGRDPETLFYWTEEEKGKRQVARYHLRPEEEHPDTFHERVASLKRKRNHVEKVIRTELLLSMMCDDHERGLPDSVLENVLLKSVSGVKKSWEQRVAQYLSQICAEHLYILRKARLEYYMLSPVFRRQVEPLGIVTDADDLPYRTPPLRPDGDRAERFEAAKAFLLQRSFQLSHPTQQTLLNVNETWVPHASLSLLNLSLPDNSRAIPLKEFYARQDVHAKKIFQSYLLRWKTDVEAALFVSLEKRFKYNYMSEESYRTSDMCVFLRLITFYMSGRLTQLVDESLEKYTQYLEGFMKPLRNGHNDSWNNGFYKNCGMAPVLPERDAPLLKLEIDCVEGEEAWVVQYTITLREMRNTLQDVVSNIVHTASGVPTVECTFLSSLVLPVQNINITHDTSKKVHATRAKIDVAFESCKSTLNNLRADYATFESLMQAEPFVDDSCLQSSDTSSVIRKINSLLKSRRNVISTSPDDVYCFMFLVDCRPVKEKLCQNIAKQIDQILLKVSQSITERALNACGLYQRLWTELQLRPKTPEAFDVFRRSTAEMREETWSVEKEDFGIVNIWKTEVLDAFNRGLSDEEADDVHTMQQWPQKIRICLEESDRLLKKEEAEFIRKLELDKALLRMDIENYKKGVKELTKLSDYDQTELASATAQEIQELLVEAQRRGEQCARHEKIFELPESQWPTIDKLVRQSTPFHRLWMATYEWTQFQPRCYETAMENLDAKKIVHCITEWHRVARTSVRALRGYPDPQGVARRLESEVATFHGYVPWITQLSLAGLRVRHWKILIAELGCSHDADLTVSYLLEWEIEKYAKFVARLGLQAKQEGEIEHQLESMKAEWRDNKLHLVDWNSCRIVAVPEAQDLLAVIDKHIMTTQLLRVEEFIAPFEKTAKEWETQLLQLQEILTQWLYLQSLWMSLKPIFDNSEVCACIGSEAKRFHTANKQWSVLMREAEINSKLIILAGSDDLLMRLKDVSMQFQKVQVELSTFLDVRRRVWPRLFWLTDNELLNVLSSDGSLEAASEHLLKCFCGIVSLSGSAEEGITGITSASGETVPLVKPVPMANRTLDIWLADVEGAMKISLQVLLHTALQEAPKTALRPWLSAWPRQVILLALKIQEDADIQEVTVTNGCKGITALKTKITRILMDLTAMAQSPVEGEEKIFLELVLLHYMTTKDKLELLIMNTTESIDDFGFKMLIRHVMADSVVQVTTLHSMLPYQYEYLGTPAPFVRTPLIDRTHRAMLVAFAGHNPALLSGPPSSGKSILVKDLSIQLGMMHADIVCSPSIEWKTILNTVSGVVAAGGWCTLTHIDRLRPEVLMKIPPLLNHIYSSAWEKSGIVIDAWHNPSGEILYQKDTFVVAATMHYTPHTPVAKQLKNIFRPIAHLSLELGVIIQHLLYLAGCTTQYGVFAPCVIRFFTQAESILGLQKPIIIIKRICEAMSRISKDKLNTSAHGPAAEEHRVLSDALYITLKPLLTQRMMGAFMSLYEDCFGEFGSLAHESRISIPIPDLGLDGPVNDEHLELLTLLQQLTLRTSVIILGGVGRGKTTLIEALVAKYPAEHRPVQYHVRPAAMSLATLYGAVTQARWQEGVLPRILHKIRPCSLAWIILDGGVGHIFDRMYSLLHTGVYHCVSGEKIPLSVQGKLIFEAVSLDDASPSLVAGAALIVLNEKLDWRPFFKKHLLTVPATHPNMRKIIDVFVHQIFRVAEMAIPKLYELTAERVTTKIPLFLAVRHVVVLYHAFLVGEECGVEEDDAIRCLVEVPLVHAIVLTFLTPFTDCAPEDRFYEELLNKWLPSWGENLHNLIPEDTPILECYPRGGKWHKLSDHYVEDGIRAHHTKSVGHFNPTPDSTRIAHLYELLVAINKPCLIWGGPSTGKTALLTQILKRMPDKYSIINTSLNYNTTASSFQQYVRIRLHKRRQGVVGPPLGKQCLIAIDDMNKPCSDLNHPDSVLEIVLQVVKQKTWYDEKADLIQLADANLVGGMQPKDCNDLRYLTSFHPLWLRKEIDGTTLWRSVASIFMGWLGKSGSGVANHLAEVIVDTWVFLSKTFKESHDTLQLWNASDVMSVVGTLIQHPRDKSLAAHSILSMAANEMLRIYGSKLVTQADVDALDSRALNTISRVMRVQFSDTVTKPSELLFSKISAKGKNNVQLTVEELINIVQLKADAWYQSSEGTSDPIKATTILSSFTKSTNALPAAVARLSGDYRPQIKKELMYVDEMWARAVNNLVKALDQRKGHCIVISDQGNDITQAAHLAAWILDMKVLHQVDPPRTSWKACVTAAIKTAADKGKRNVAWVLSESWLTEEAVADLALLTESRDYCGLLTTHVTYQLQHQLLDEATTEVYSYITNKIASSLHIVLLCSSPSERLLKWRRCFPALLRNCNIVRTGTVVSEAAAVRLASTIIKRNLPEINPEDITPTAKVLYCVHSEAIVLFANTRPYQFRQLVLTFCHIYEARRVPLEDTHKKYALMMRFLRCVNEQATKYGSDIVRLDPVLAALFEQKNNLERRIKDKKVIEGMRQADFEKLEASCLEKVQNHTRTKQECKDMLAEAGPSLEKARQDLHSLDDKQLAAVRFVPAPAPIVKKVMSAVCFVLGEKHDSSTRGGADGAWCSAQAVLGDPGFIRKLTALSTDKLPPKTLEYLSTCVAQPSFRPEKVKATFAAVEKLCAFLVKLHHYLKTVATVQPKQEQIRREDKGIKELIDAMEGKRDIALSLRREIDLTKRQLSFLQSRYTETAKMKDSFLERCNEADKLLKSFRKLSEEWALETAKLSLQKDTLTGSCVVGAGFMTYLTANKQNHSFLTTVSRYLAVPTEIKPSDVHDYLSDSPLTSLPSSFDSAFSVSDTLNCTALINKWTTACVLPNTERHRSNAAVVLSCMKTPLLFDSHGVGKKWLKEHLQHHISTKWHSLALNNDVTSAMRSGLPCIIEVDDIIPALLPFLSVQPNRNEDTVEFIYGREIETKKGFNLYLMKSVVSEDGCEKWLKMQPDHILQLVTAISFCLSEEEEMNLTTSLVAESIDNTLTEELWLTTQQLLKSTDHAMTTKNTLLTMLTDSATEELLWRPCETPEATLNVPTTDLDLPSKPNIDPPSLLCDKELIKLAVCDIKNSENADLRVANYRNTRNMQRNTLTKKYAPVAMQVKQVLECYNLLANIYPVYHTGYTFWISAVTKELSAQAETKLSKLTNAPWDVRLDCLKSVATSILFKMMSLVFPPHIRSVFGLLISKRLEDGNLPKAEWDLFVQCTSEDESLDPHPFLTRKQHSAVKMLVRSLPAFKDLLSSIENKHAMWKPFLEGSGEAPLSWRGDLSPFQMVVLARHVSPSLLGEMMQTMAGVHLPHPLPEGSAALFSDILFTRVMHPGTPVVLLVDGQTSLNTRPQLEKIGWGIGGYTVFSIPPLGTEGIVKLKAVIKKTEQREEVKQDGIWVLLEDVTKYDESTFRALMCTIDDMCKLSRVDIRFRIFLEVDVKHWASVPPSLMNCSLKLFSYTTTSMKAHIVNSLEAGPLTRQRFASADHPRLKEYHQLLRIATTFHAVLVWRQLVGVPVSGVENHRWDDRDLKMLVVEMERCNAARKKSDLWIATSNLIQDCVYGAYTTELESSRLANLFLLVVEDLCSDEPSKWYAPSADHTEQLAIASHLPRFFPDSLYHMSPCAQSEYVERNADTLLSIITQCEGNTRVQSVVGLDTETSLDMVINELQNLEIQESKQPASDTMQLMREAEIHMHNKQMKSLLTQISQCNTLLLGDVPSGWDKVLPSHYMDITRKGQPLAFLLALLEKRKEYLNGWNDRTLWLPAFSVPYAVLMCFTNVGDDRFRAVLLKGQPHETEGRVELTNLSLHNASWCSTDKISFCKTLKEEPFSILLQPEECPFTEGSTIELPLLLSGSTTTTPVHCCTIEFPTSAGSEQACRSLAAHLPCILSLLSNSFS